MAKFEEDLNRLEEINALLKSPDIELDKAADLFEEGVQLAQKLEKDLGKIEGRIEVLINKPTSPEETPVLELFPELRSDED